METLSSHLDLYTIPSHSFWFSWDSIHDTERHELRSFFDGSSFTRTPKIYKEYRDFIISKYRENPSRRLTFTEVRKSLVGDVSTLNKVFNFLDKWGLINFGAPPPASPPVVDDGVRVRVEEGAPVGVRVLGTPNTWKPLKPPPSLSSDGGGDGGVKLPPLASFSDVFGGGERGKGVVCGNCKDNCGLKYYECTNKENYTICLKCFEKGAYGENKISDDFKLNDTIETNTNKAGVWSETETLLLLESVLKHGDDWELVAQNVKTKSKLECISRLIELPFGELMLGSHGKLPARPLVDESEASQEQKTLNVSQENDIVVPDLPQENNHEVNNNVENNHNEENGHQEIVVRENAEEIDNLEPPLKKSRTDSSDPSRSLMEQVALISTMVAPRITAAAANASVSVLCDGNPLLREVFYSDDQPSGDEPRSGNLNKEIDGALQSEDSEMKDASLPSETDKSLVEGDSIPVALRMRAAVATALGAASARAKILADQEEREIEHLMAFIIETQVKKLQRKVKNFEVLENMMEKEHSLLEESKSDIIAERLATLQRIFDAGISRPRDFSW